MHFCVMAILSCHGIIAGFVAEQVKGYNPPLQLWGFPGRDGSS